MKRHTYTYNWLHILPPPSICQVHRAIRYCSEGVERCRSCRHFLFVLVNCSTKWNEYSIKLNKKMIVRMLFLSFLYGAGYYKRFLICPISGRVRPGGTYSSSPTSCSGRNCWSSSRSFGGRNLHLDGCKIVWKHKRKANVYKNGNRFSEQNQKKT